MNIDRILGDVRSTLKEDGESAVWELLTNTDYSSVAAAVVAELRGEVSVVTLERIERDIQTRNFKELDL